MRLDISDILREVGKFLTYDMHEPPLVDEDIECTRSIEGRITFNNTGGTLLVNGDAHTRIALPCSRCDQYFEHAVDLTIEEMFELKHLSAGPRTLQTVTVVEEDESPIAEKLFDGHVFELTEMLRQYILLDQPTQPLPAQDETGRCMHCKRTVQEVLGSLDPVEGASESPVNPAFAKLTELLNRQEG